MDALTSQHELSSQKSRDHSSSSRLSVLQDTKLWLKSPVFDLGLVMGGAAFTLSIAALAFRWPSWLPVFFWVWVVVFEGSHFWATLSRTYLDSHFRKQQGAVLLGSLCFFAFPALALWVDHTLVSSILLDQASGYSDAAAEGKPLLSFALLYGFFIFLWSLYHNARQHYGFMSIYAHKAKLAGDFKASLSKALYLSVCAAQVYFLVNFKAMGVFQLELSASQHPNLAFLLQVVPLTLSFVAGLWLVKCLIEGYAEYRQRCLVAVLYVATCLVFYGTMFYVVAPKDTFLQNTSGAQTLMLVTIMNSLFHNIQYHAIVWYYNSKRFHRDSKTKEKHYGLASLTNGGTLRYLTVAVCFGVVFGWIMWHLGDWPNAYGDWTQPHTHSWAYVLFFGIIGHHFYLDQKIWRPSKQQDLKHYIHQT